MAKILLIDDEPTLRMLVLEVLSQAGYEVFEAVNGKDGLAAILREQPDLVICDMLMPVMDGAELYTALRAGYPQFNDMPFVFLSASADAHHVEQGLRLGADAYLTKPVDFELLENSVAELLKHTTAL